MTPFLRASYIIVGYLLLAAAACAAPRPDPAEPSPQREFTILKNLVPVTARAAEAPMGPPFDLDLCVRYKDDRFRLTTSILAAGTIPEAIRQQKRYTGWKGPYVFVRTSCGGGNRWRCTREEVFRVRNGHLVHLGSVFARPDDPPGSSFQGGRFVDLYNKFEMNDLTGHADAPAPWLVLYEKRGRFCVDVPGTWQKNRTEFQRNHKLVHAFMSAKKRVGDKDRFDTTGALLFNAVLSKYCSKTEYLKELGAAAERALDKEQLCIFLEIVSQVVPGELPAQEPDSVALAAIRPGKPETGHFPHGIPCVLGTP